MPPPLKPRQGLISGTVVTMQRRNIKLSKPQRHTKFREEYASEKGAGIAAYVWEKKGIPLLADEVGDGKKREASRRAERESAQEAFPV